MKKLNYLVLLSVCGILSSCKDMLPGRARKMYDAYGNAVNDYQNGDSSTLIGVILGTIVLGLIWYFFIKK